MTYQKLDDEELDRQRKGSAEPEWFVKISR